MFVSISRRPVPLVPPVRVVPLVRHVPYGTYGTRQAHIHLLICTSSRGHPYRRADKAAGIAKTTAIFLGIPLVAGYLTRTIGERRRGREWYEARVLPKIGPIALYGLLFTVVVLFALQGDTILSEPLDVVRIAVPLLAYFAIMWFGAFWVSRRLQLTYERTASLSFSAASNDFDRGRDRGVRCDQRRGTRRRRRPAHRGPGARRARLRRPVAAPPAALAHRGSTQ